MTSRVTPEGIRVICAAAGKCLTKDGVYSNTDIYLGAQDAPENWTEVNEVPAEPDDTLAELDEGWGVMTDAEREHD